MLVSGEEKEPGAAEVAELQDWRLRSQKAAGALFLAVSMSRGSILGELSLTHCYLGKTRVCALAQRPGARFNAYDALFSIRSVQMSLCRL